MSTWREKDGEGRTLTVHLGKTLHGQLCRLVRELNLAEPTAKPVSKGTFVRWLISKAVETYYQEEGEENGQAS